MYIYMIYVYIYNMHIYTHTYIYKYTLTYIYIYIYIIYIYMQSSALGALSSLVISVVLYLLTRATLMSPRKDETRVCGYIYIYIYIHTHTHTHGTEHIYILNISNLFLEIITNLTSPAHSDRFVKF